MIMKKLLFGLLVSGAGLANAAPPQADDRVALLQVAADNDAAWNAKDWATIAAQFAADGSIRVAPSPQVESGREAIGRFFQRSFAARPDGLRHVTAVRRMEMVSNDLALADGHVRIERHDGAQVQLLSEFSTTSLLVRTGKEWKIHSVRAHPLTTPARAAATR
jgi:uncharacterized protein (TIGR02246 family)